MNLKKFFSNMMMLCVAIVAMSITMASCSDKDDNGLTPPPASETDAPQDTEEVGEGMEMPVNEFLEVPPVDGDPNIINALKSIDRVTDVKAFEIVDRLDYYEEKIINKTAYYFNYKQDIDHDNPSKGWFKQQCVLTVAGKDRPTVLHTEGYALYGNNRLQDLSEPMLVSVLDANCLQVEYRYHGWSLPEGYTNKWHYLNARQQSADLHNIVTAIKKSGVVGNGKWLSTGVSKNGMTTAHYAYHYPNDMDAYVPFCAPFLLDLTDNSPYSHLLTKEAFGGDEVLMNKMKTVFRTYCGSRALQDQCVQIYRTKYPTDTRTDAQIRKLLLLCLFEYYYNRMSYVAYRKWEDMIPAAGDPAQKFYDIIMANSKAKYPEEKDADYKRRQETVDDLEPADDGSSEPHFLTRGQATVKRSDPYTVQVCIELGGYGYVIDWVSDLLSAEDKEYILSRGPNPSTYGVTYDGGKFISEFFDGIQQSTCHMMFVYGMQDPWTGGQIPDGRMGVNCRKLYISHPTDHESSAGLHNDYIDQWNASERSQLFQWLNQLGFLPK